MGKRLLQLKCRRMYVDLTATQAQEPDRKNKEPQGDHRLAYQLAHELDVGQIDNLWICFDRRPGV